MKEKNKEIEETLNHLQKDFDCTYFYGSAKNMEDEGISKMMKIIIECLYEQIPKHELKSSKLKESRKKAGENRIKDQRESFKIRSQIIDDYPK